MAFHVLALLIVPILYPYALLRHMLIRIGQCVTSIHETYRGFLLLFHHDGFTVFTHDHISFFVLFLYLNQLRYGISL